MEKLTADGKLAICQGLSNMDCDLIMDRNMLHNIFAYYDPQKQVDEFKNQFPYNVVEQDPDDPRKKFEIRYHTYKHRTVIGFNVRSIDYPEDFNGYPHEHEVDDDTNELPSRPLILYRTHKAIDQYLSFRDNKPYKWTRFSYNNPEPTDEDDVMIQSYLTTNEYWTDPDCANN